jgi:hypothetical protein
VHAPPVRMHDADPKFVVIETVPEELSFTLGELSRTSTLQVKFWFATISAGLQTIDVVVWDGNIATELVPSLGA